MNIKQQTIVILVLAMSLVVSGCGSEQSSLTLDPTPKATPKPFTSPITFGAWVGDISIPIASNKNESVTIRFLIDENGKMIDYYQIYLTSCSLVIGDGSIPIKQGTFSFSIDQSCNFTGTISISGVFVSKDKLEGTVTVDSQTSYWEATLAN